MKRIFIAIAASLLFITAPAYGQMMFNNPSGESFTIPPFTFGVRGSQDGNLKLNSAGGGTSTLTVPNNANDFIFQLPNTAGTIATNATSPVALNTESGAISCATCVTSSGGGAISGTAPVSVSAAGVVSLNAAGVTYAKIQNLGALAVMGRSANTSGVGADIQASAATDAVLRESGSTIGFGTIATGGIANNAVTLAKMATQAANTILGNATAGAAVPTALTAPSCSTAASALIWTTSTGFGCNTAIAAPLSGITGLGTGVGTALGINVGSAGAPVVNGGALGTPSSGVGTNLTALNASNLSSGTVAAARLPNPTASTLGGIQSYAAVSNQWVNAISTSGVPSSTQPAMANISDYETGTWTPVLTFVTPGDLSVTYSDQNGSYVRVGKSVTVFFGVTASAFTWTTASGAAEITGLPFTASNSPSPSRYMAALNWAGITKASYTNIVARVDGSTNYIIFAASGSGQALSSVVAADMPTGGAPTLRGTVTYLIP